MQNWQVRIESSFSDQLATINQFMDHQHFNLALMIEVKSTSDWHVISSYSCDTYVNYGILLSKLLAKSDF